MITLKQAKELTKGTKLKFFSGREGKEITGKLVRVNTKNLVLEVPNDKERIIKKKDALGKPLPDEVIKVGDLKNIKKSLNAVRL